MQLILRVIKAVGQSAKNNYKKKDKAVGVCVKQQEEKNMAVILA
jgi:hypothetical protein